MSNKRRKVSYTDWKAVSGSDPFKVRKPSIARGVDALVASAYNEERTYDITPEELAEAIEEFNAIKEKPFWEEGLISDIGAVQLNLLTRRTASEVVFDEIICQKINARTLLRYGIDSTLSRPLYGFLMVGNFKPEACVVGVLKHQEFQTKYYPPSLGVVFSRRE